MNHQKINISRDEWLVIGFITVLAVVIIGLLPKIMNSQWFTNLIPPLQYLSYNFGFILLTVALLGAPISYILKHRVRFWMMLRGGLSSWLIFSFILDVWQPPFAFGTNGEQLILKSESLVGTSVDYMMGWLYTRLFPFQNIILNVPLIGKISLLFVMVYLVTPILAVLAAALILKPGILARLLGSKTS